MLKWIGTLGAVALAATLYEKRRSPNAVGELESVAEGELRKILLYAAAPTFLAPVSEAYEVNPRRRWMDRVAN